MGTQTQMMMQALHASIAGYQMHTMRLALCATLLFAQTGITGAGLHESRGLGFAMSPSAAMGSALTPGTRTSRAMSSRSAQSPLQLRAQVGEENLVEKYRKLLNDVDSKPMEVSKPQANFFSKMIDSAKAAAKTCETDYDCNPDGRNWPLRCVRGLFSNTCIESDDDINGGRGVMAYAMEPIPVRVEDGYYGKGAGPNYGPLQ